jgi:hypothetical protein
MRQKRTEMAFPTISVTIGCPSSRAAIYASTAAASESEFQRLLREIKRLTGNVNDRQQCTAFFLHHS